MNVHRPAVVNLPDLFEPAFKTVRNVSDHDKARREEIRQVLFNEASRDRENSRRANAIMALSHPTYGQIVAGILDLELQTDAASYAEAVRETAAELMEYCPAE